MSTYLIGDIQGCYDPLQRLLEKIDFDQSTDNLWFCGDLVNRGGQSLKTLRLIHSLRSSVSVTLGNHDLHLLAEQQKHPGGNSRNDEFNEILKATDCETLIGWLNTQPLAAWSQEHQLLRVHAGVIPQWSWQDTIAAAQEVSSVLQSDRRTKFLKKMYKNKPRLWKQDRTGWGRLRLITNILTRLRFCDDVGRASFSDKGPPGSQALHYRPWFKHKHRQTRDVRVAFGHWAALGVRVKKRYIAMDSGCVWGGELSALRIEDQQLYQVPLNKPD